MPPLAAYRLPDRIEQGCLRYASNSRASLDEVSEPRTGTLPVGPGREEILLRLLMVPVKSTHDSQGCVTDALKECRVGITASRDVFHAIGVQVQSWVSQSCGFESEVEPAE